jgi:radical SAM protein with 4Fe4S-binding SPASM domain
MNEPFLDKTLIEKSRHIHRMVPKGKVVVTTNAGVLTRDLVDEILRENPFHAIYISMQGIEKEAYEATMRGRMNFEKTKENVEYLVDQRNKLQPGFKVVVTMVQTNLVDVAKAVAYWQSRGVESKYTPLENRGGNIEAFDGLNPCTKRVYKDCTRLMKHAYILFNGDMVLCCTDYYKTMVLGNVAETSLHEVWNSERAVGIRRNFLRGDLSENPLCANCYIADTKGGS